MKAFARDIRERFFVSILIECAHGCVANPPCPVPNELTSLSFRIFKFLGWAVALGHSTGRTPRPGFKSKSRTDSCLSLCGRKKGMGMLAAGDSKLPVKEGEDHPRPVHAFEGGGFHFACACGRPRKQKCLATSDLSSNKRRQCGSHKRKETWKGVDTGGTHSGNLLGREDKAIRRAVIRRPLKGSREILSAS